jgi:FtsH-binding integral membrane protein
VRGQTAVVYARSTFTPAPILQTVVALVAIAAFLATGNPVPAAIIAVAGVIAWAGYLLRRRRG